MASAVSAKDRDRLVANGLAHKIRNSLNAMRAHLALAQKFSTGCTEPRVPDQLQKLEEAVVGIDDLIKEYLALASPEKNDWQEVELILLIREVLQFEALDLEQGKVKVREELEVPAPKVYVDPQKLKRALLNLVINARQAMSDGGTLTIRTRPNGRTRVVLEVSDTGIGIPAADCSRIFEPFFTTKPEGLGLGLAVVKRSVEDLRGQIGFESQEGQGTTFRIVLPTATRQRAALERENRRQQWLQPTG